MMFRKSLSKKAPSKKRLSGRITSRVILSVLVALVVANLVWNRRNRNRQSPPPEPKFEAYEYEATPKKGIPMDPSWKPQSCYPLSLKARIPVQIFQDLRASPQVQERNREFAIRHRFGYILVNATDSTAIREHPFSQDDVDTVVFLGPHVSFQRHSIDLFQSPRTILYNPSADSLVHIWTNEKKTVEAYTTRAIQEALCFDPKADCDEAEESCALLFFGLARSFRRYVLPSIRHHILAVNPRCDIFAQTPNITEFTAPRSHESGNPIYPQDVYELTPHVELENDIEHAVNYSHYHAYFPQNVGWSFPSSMDNMIKQWHSIERVWKLMEDYQNEHGTNYTRVGLFRLDVVYMTPIDITIGDAVVPLFPNLTPNHANDRAFYGKYEYAKMWATTRFSSIEWAKQRKIIPEGIHSESYMRQVILKQIPVAVQEEDDCFVRTRATGVISAYDCFCDKNFSMCPSIENVDMGILVSCMVGETCVQGFRVLDELGRRWATLRCEK